LSASLPILGVGGNHLQRILDEGVTMTIDLSSAPAWLMCVPVLVPAVVALSAEARRWVKLLRRPDSQLTVVVEEYEDKKAA